MAATDPAFLDTNVLMYALDPRDPAKQSLAVALVEQLGSEGRARWSAHRC